MKKGYIIAIASAFTCCIACQKSDFETVCADGYSIVRFAPSVGGILSGVKSSASEDVAATFMHSLALTSEDGSFMFPMDLTVTSLESGDGTKAALINEKGGITDAEFAEAVDNTFWVSAWDDATTPTQIIPDARAKTFTGYVSGNDTDGFYQKVMYRDGVGGSHYWMTVQPQTVSVSNAPEVADDEYIWKATEATKTFYAYANIPESGATMQVDGSGQILTYTVPATAAAQTDILLGFYSGSGKTGATGSEKMTGTASLKFDHPLTAVRFKQGDMTGVNGIKSITLSGLASGGTVTMDAEGHIGDWTVDSTEEYKTEVTLSNGEDPLDVDADSFIGTDSEGKYNGAFLLIPQTLSDDHKATVTVVLVTASGDVTVSADIASGTWLAGETNTYTLGYSATDPVYGLTQQKYNDGGTL